MHHSADDSFVTVDDDDYDFVPGTPPSKKVIEPFDSWKSISNEIG